MNVDSFAMFSNIACKQEEDSDYLCKLARLVNCIGLQIALSWTK